MAETVQIRPRSGWSSPLHVIQSFLEWVLALGPTATKKDPETTLVYRIGELVSSTHCPCLLGKTGEKTSTNLNETVMLW